MGNTIAFDCEEFYFKCSYAYDKKPECIANISKYITWTELNTETINALLGKMLFTDISDQTLKDKDQLESIKKFANEEFIKGNTDQVFEINITGNGFDIYRDEINVFFGHFLNKYVFHKQKHIKCIVSGIKLLRSIKEKPFFYSLEPRSVLDLNKIKLEECTPDKKKYRDLSDLKGDAMVVNIRSGVSYYQVDQENNFERISGSIIGESTFASLIRLLAGYENVMEALDEGMNGDFSVVDMTVGDIYGGGCTDLGLPQDLLASSMGKAQYLKEQDREKLQPKDLAKSIIVMFAINIGLMTNLVVDSVEDVKTVIVLGFPHLAFQTTLSTVLKVYDKKEKEFLFIDNVEFVGCLGMNMELREVTSMSEV